MTKITRLTNQQLGKSKQGRASSFRRWFTAIVQLRAMNLILVGILIVCGVSYLGIVNATASDTFHIYELNRKIQTTQVANQKLDLEMSEVLSLPHVNEMSQQYNLVTATDIHYLNDSTAVALTN